MLSKFALYLIFLLLSHLTRTAPLLLDLVLTNLLLPNLLPANTFGLSSLLVLLPSLQPRSSTFLLLSLPELLLELPSAVSALYFGSLGLFLLLAKFPLCLSSPVFSLLAL